MYNNSGWDIEWHAGTGATHHITYDMTNLKLRSDAYTNLKLKSDDYNDTCQF